MKKVLSLVALAMISTIMFAVTMESKQIKTKKRQRAVRLS